MDKRYVMAGLLVVIIIAVALSMKTTPQNTAGKTGCDWRPTSKYIACRGETDGFYYNGKSCIGISSCGVEENIPPFKSMEECKAQCEAKITFPIDSEEKAIVFAKTDKNISEYIMKNKVEITARFDSHNNKWVVKASRIEITDNCFRIEFKPDGTVIRKSRDYCGA